MIPRRQLAIGMKRYVGARALEDIPDHHDPAGMRIRQRLEQNGIHRTEDRGAGADAQRQRECADGRKARTMAQPASGIAQIGEQSSDRILPSVRAHLFPEDRGVAEFQPRGPPCIVGRVSALDQRGRGLFEVVPHLVGDILVRDRSIRQHAQSACQLAPERHAVSPPPSRPARWPTPGASNPRFRYRVASSRRE